MNEDENHDVARQLGNVPTYIIIKVGLGWRNKLPKGIFYRRLLVRQLTDFSPLLTDNQLNYAGPHKHCYNCYSFTLCSRNSDKEESCDFTRCLHKCGAIFHGCKLQEHLELCPNVLVSCINEHIG